MEHTLILVTCEHGGNRVPQRYRHLFEGRGELLRSHRGYDIGALRFAHELAATLDAPLIAATATRLLVDLNRSRHHPRLYSEVTRGMPAQIRHAILGGYYLPYRNRVENWISHAIERGARVIHLSSHSFTPELDGRVRQTDIGLLYDPARPEETAFCRALQDELRTRAPLLKARMNYPYRGTADGLTVHLRKRFPAKRYLGIEIEINQKHARAGAAHWASVRRALTEAFKATLTPMQREPTQEPGPPPLATAPAQWPAARGSSQ